jgi:uncharacterized protein (TIGR02145 family)
MTPIVYTTTNSATISMTGGAFPSGISGSSSGNLYTISGTPSVAGTFGYSLTASVNGCTSAAAAGTITMVYAAAFTTTSTGGPNTAYTNTTWMIGTQTWSDRIVLAVCTNSARFSTTTSTYVAEHKAVDGRYYYSWTCVYNNQTTLCPSGWRVPSLSDFSTLISNLGGNDQFTRDVLIAAWGFGGGLHGDSLHELDYAGKWWTVTTDYAHSAYLLDYQVEALWLDKYSRYVGYQVRCVK